MNAAVPGVMSEVLGRRKILRPNPRLSDFRHQVRLLHVGELDFNFLAGRVPHFLARLRTGYTQVQREAAVVKTFQPAFKVPVVVQRLPRRQLQAAAGEAAEIRRLDQPAIQSGRRNFQRVRTGHYVFNVKNGAKFAAEVGAVFVRYAVRQSSPGIGLFSSCRLIKKHPQHARLASTEKLDFNYFEPAGSGDAVRDSPHAINVKRHESNNLQAMAATTGGLQLKSGLAPTGVLRQMPVLHNSSQLPNIRPCVLKDKPPRGSGDLALISQIKHNSHPRKRLESLRTLAWRFHERSPSALIPARFSPAAGILRSGAEPRWRWRRRWWTHHH